MTGQAVQYEIAAVPVLVARQPKPPFQDKKIYKSEVCIILQLSNAFFPPYHQFDSKLAIKSLQISGGVANKSDTLIYWPKNSYLRFAFLIAVFR
jgi:hypothetical protein